MEFMPFIMFIAVCAVLMLGYPVAFTLSGVALMFALLGTVTGQFDGAFLEALPNRLFGIMSNQLLIAVPLFVFMGIMLEKSKIAENLLKTMGGLFGSMRGGLAISVILVGMLLAASTGIIGATVVTMGVITLPTMLKNNYSPALATGTICATGTLGQIIPPSMALILLADVLSSAYQQAQLKMGIFSPETISVADLFMGALIPGLILVAAYIIYVLVLAWLKPETAPAMAQTDDNASWMQAIKQMAPPLLLIIAVLGSILSGIATPTEAAGVGAIGATLLAFLNNSLSMKQLKETMDGTLNVSAMVFMIFFGAAVFSLVFRGYGGDELVEGFFQDMPGGVIGATIVVMVVIFFLGFILDFIEITFVVVPIVAPALLAMGLDPVWLGIMIAINLQTSFLTPPFGFALFYLRGVAGDAVKSLDIYKGVMPFIVIQLLVLILLACIPELATWLPDQIYN
ncbi:TRAP transporter large permease [Bermanella sp. WJH001]|uniref:TRAP transporter large permease n=1 Tax=Bermanella sp. WJH001 TaxID=3048005 RepID=UPI0024BE65CC|nr:TRAP transporter large permease subunit [Bermanella sp. WJH001]MDJ1538835.1 TRAP transporter large permease subunit [Bermanella sp. WJH001]